MSDESETRATETPATKAEPARRSAAEQRTERLKAALRDNLRRRKAQLRGRSETAGDADETPDSDG